MCYHKAIKIKEVFSVMGLNQSAMKAFYEVTDDGETLNGENLAAEMKGSFAELMNARVVRFKNKLILDFSEDEIYSVTFEKIG